MCHSESLKIYISDNKPTPFKTSGERLLHLSSLDFVKLKTDTLLGGIEGRIHLLDERPRPPRGSQPSDAASRVASLQQSVVVDPGVGLAKYAALSICIYSCSYLSRYWAGVLGSWYSFSRRQDRRQGGHLSSPQVHFLPTKAFAWDSLWRAVFLHRWNQSPLFWPKARKHI